MSTPATHFGERPPPEGTCASARGEEPRLGHQHAGSSPPPGDERRRATSLSSFPRAASLPSTTSTLLALLLLTPTWTPTLRATMLGKTFTTATTALPSWLVLLPPDRAGCQAATCFDLMDRTRANSGSGTSSQGPMPNNLCPPGAVSH